jgi:hypothetical protein
MHVVYEPKPRTVMKSKSIRSAAFCLAMLAMIPSAHAWGDREQAALAGALIGGLIASNAQVAGGAAAFPAPVGPPVYLATPGVAYRVSPGYVTGPVYAPAPANYPPAYYPQAIAPVVQYRVAPSYAPAYVQNYGPAYGPAYAPAYGTAYAPAYMQRRHHGHHHGW